ncbi:preprotein translocase subunit YajC [Kocuria tytonis]|uniref:Preprotein translocase subunit YajC n=1 Tax=Kocuria tytonis TaxID=2054280 RepID=A0A495A8R2_9MICC|nr:preprotein translocase subunit YajC [Kocuria tytonis]
MVLVAMVLLLWLPMRRQKKAQTEMKAKQATMEPGTRVMTSFGLFGTLRDMDREQNRAVLEISPGQLVTVHSQTVTTVVDETPTVTEDPATGTPGSGAPAAGTPTAPRATTADGAADGSTAARTTEGTPGVTDSAESTERRTWRDARGHDDRDTPTT